MSKFVLYLGIRFVYLSFRSRTNNGNSTDRRGGSYDISESTGSNSETLFEQTAQIGITFDKTNGGKFYRNIFSIFFSVVGLQSIKSFSFPNLDCVIFSIPGPVIVWFINFISIPSAAFV